MMQYSDITNLRLLVDPLEVRRESVVDLWVSGEEIRKIFDRFEIESEWFKENYGDHILGHFIKIIRGDKKPGNCPYMNRMVMYLKDRNLAVTEIFTICIHLRKSVRDTLFNESDLEMQSFLNRVNLVSICKEINQVFDANLTGVLDMFQTTISLKDRQVQESLEIVEKNVIISKTDLKGIIIYVSEAFCEASGYSKKELIGKPHNIVRHPDMPSAFFEDLWDTIKQGKVWQGEIKNLRKDGKPYWVEGNVQPLLDREGNLYGYMAIRHDITHTVMMFTDPLTRVHNRLKFEESLELEITRFNRYGQSFCIIILDIDNFKSINDTRGHKIGDEVLIQLTEIIRQSIRESDIFARWGGEEFVLLSHGSIEDAHKQAERLRSSIEEARILSDRKVTCSFGVTKFLSDDTEDSLFIRADTFLYQAKESGKNQVISDLTECITGAPHFDPMI